MAKDQIDKLKSVLLLGSGGRECALAYCLSKSAILKTLYIAPGNLGTKSYGINLPYSVKDFKSISKLVSEYTIDILICGPEQPLAEGLMDYLRENHPSKELILIGPEKKGAKLESSKSFAKEFMIQYNIPTADYRSFDAEQIEKGLDFISSLRPPIVLKADGLASGKGVVICNDHPSAEIEFIQMLEGKFGKASAKVVIEEFLRGIEFSVFILTNGDQYILLPEAKDYKKIGEGDSGLNTGGMGSVSPVPFMDEHLLEKVKQKIIDPTLRGLKEEGIPYLGFIFFGLILVDHEPYLIEYNCRMGDPESESVFPRIQSDFLNSIMSIAKNAKQIDELEITPETVATIMLVSEGYPESFSKGFPIYFPEEIPRETLVFHAGTIQEGNNILTDGGRVLAISSFGKSMQDALQCSLKTAESISFQGKYYRKDIGFDL